MISSVFRSNKEPKKNCVIIKREFILYKKYLLSTDVSAVGTSVGGIFLFSTVETA